MQKKSWQPYRIRLTVTIAFVLLILATTVLWLLWTYSLISSTYDRAVTSQDSRFKLVLGMLDRSAGRALLANPELINAINTRQPYRLPLGELPVQDPARALDLAGLAGCNVIFDHGRYCAGISNNPTGGAMLYVAGSFDLLDEQLKGHKIGDPQLEKYSRLYIRVYARGKTTEWLAPFQSAGKGYYLSGYRLARALKSSLPKQDKEFSGTARYYDDCTRGDACQKATAFSVRLPIDVFRNELYENKVWPPEDVSKVKVAVSVIHPIADGEKVLFDNGVGGKSDVEDADFRALLLPGEVLRVGKVGHGGDRSLISVDSGVPLAQVAPIAFPVSYFLERSKYAKVLTTVIRSSGSQFEVSLTSDGSTTSSELSAIMSKSQLLLFGILGLALLTWWVVQRLVVARIAELTKCAKEISTVVTAGERLHDIKLNLEKMIGNDEIGVLALALDDMVRKVKEDVQRDILRAEREKEAWEAIGHEILSPLAVLQGMQRGNTVITRQVERMRNAIECLYGTSSPSEALAERTVDNNIFDLVAFLNELAENAARAQFHNVVLERNVREIYIRGDDNRLEDALTHILTNAKRYRRQGSPIEIRLETNEQTALISIRNYGPSIPEDLIDTIFKYGVSDGLGQKTNMGQGLFVTKTYISNMGGEITAENTDDGVQFKIIFPVLRVSR